MQRMIRTGMLVLVGLAAAWVLMKLPPGTLPALNRSSQSTDADAPPSGETIRIASFNIQAFGQAKLQKPEVMRVLADIVRRFDIVAIQEIRCESPYLVPQFVEAINAGGCKYDFEIGPRLGRTSSKEQYAFVFDTRRIEIDRRFTYTVDDRGDRLHREPLVAWFRVRGPPTEQAFTFTLVNIHTDPDEVVAELDALDDVFRAVQHDGRDEDDVIMLGDFNARANRLGQLGRLPGITPAITGDKMFTNTQQTKQYDNILFHKEATSEFTGRSGVLNVMSEFQLTFDKAKQVSDHFPIWAEFSIYEGGQAGYVARRPGAAR
jgi:deoxyribonuclease-1-like protein